MNPLTFVDDKEQEGNIKLYSDPFNKDSFSSAAIFVYKDKVNASVSFVNGDTKGEQQFREKDLESTLIKIKAFIESLDK